MKNTRLWIADPEVSYAEAFQEYANLKKSHLFQVRTCTDRKQLADIFQSEDADILLVSADWYEYCRRLVQKECIVLLSEGSIPEEFSMYPAVYKYQSVESILREVMYCYSEQIEETEYVMGIRRDNRVIGVYSPVGGSGKTMFALTLGQILAENQNVLYLNLEECSGFRGLFGEGHWNLSDLIYFFRQKNKTQFLYRLNSMVHKLNRMDYIPPCETYTDFRQITVEEWQKLLYLIRVQSTYDCIVLDMGNLAGNEPDLLRQCDGIYMPVRKDLISQAKIRQWEKNIQILDSMDVLERTQKIELPICDETIDRETDISMLPQQKLGNYVKVLLQE